MQVKVLSGTVFGARFALLEEIETDLPGIRRYEAHDSRLDRRTVVDVVTAEDAGAVRRGATRASRLRDPRLARIVATGREQGPDGELTYVAVESVPGAVLADVLREHRLDSRRAVAVVGGAARALAAARPEGLSHGFLRPEAVTVTERGRVVVAGVGIDGEAAAQAGLVPPPSEASDARALGMLLVHAATGIAPDEATPADLPADLPSAAHALAVATLEGSPPATVGAVVSALSPFDSRALVGFTAAIAHLPPTPAIARARAEAAAREEERVERERQERLEASRAVVAAETLALAAHEADEAVAEDLASPELREALIESEEAQRAAEGDDAGETEEAPPVTQEIPPGAAVQPDGPADKYEASFDTLEIMVAAQNVEREQGTWELLLEALHRRWPRSSVVTRSLERARERAISGGPLNGGRVVMVAAIALVVVAVMIAISWLDSPLSGDIQIEPDPSIIPNPAVTSTSSPSASPNA